jgi:hypothetical protein
MAVSTVNRVSLESRLACGVFSEKDTCKNSPKRATKSQHVGLKPSENLLQIGG